MKKTIIIPLIISALSSGCNSSDSNSMQVGITQDTNLSNIQLTNRSVNCADYTGSYFANVVDIPSGTEYLSDVNITSNSSDCIVASNGIPNHNFNANNTFTNSVLVQNHRFEVPRSPSPSGTDTPLRLGALGVFLNGVALDIVPHICYQSNGQQGSVNYTCDADEMRNPWRFDLMSPFNRYGAEDSNNAHPTVESGQYHYHGTPNALYDLNCESSGEVSPVIGFAADGYPLFGACFSDNGTVRKATSSYRLKNNGGPRQAVAGYPTPVAGQGDVVSNNYDGQFRGDWEFVNNAGDLDACNGMTVNGQYGYFVTDTYPWILNCFKGTPKSPFLN